MTNEPERNIEKRLRAYAQKRRQDAGEPLELHPATRRMLQEEVSRLRAKNRGASWLVRALAALRIPAQAGQRFAVAACALAALGVAAALFLPALSRSKSRGTVAKWEQVEIKAAAEKEHVAMAERPPQPLTLESAPHREMAGHDESGKLELAKTPPAATVVPPPQPSASPAPAATETLAKVTETHPPAGAVAAAQPTAPVYTQNFAQATLRQRQANTLNQPPVQAVLNAFRIEQAGEAIRIIDNDGSVYAGQVQLVGQTTRSGTGMTAGFVGGTSIVKSDASTRAVARATRDTAAQPQLAAPTGGEVAPTEGQNFFFRVTGTNRVLNEPVVFTGYLFMPTNVPTAPAGQTTDVKGAQLLNTSGDRKQLQPAQVQLQNWRVNGTAVVGKDQTIVIDAESVGAP